MNGGEVKPCPFCGGEGDPNGIISWAVDCPECLTRGPYADTESEAIAAWNQRAPSTELEELRKVNEELVGALGFYVSICGNTAGSVTRESAQDAYRLAKTALANTRAILSRASGDGQ